MQSIFLQKEVPMATTLVAIAAHPADAVFTMGAAVPKHIQNGGKGVFLALTASEKGAPANIPLEKYGELQREASEKAAKMLGAEAEILTYPCAEIPLNDRVAQAVSDVVRPHRPDVVVTHWSGNRHKDHQSCHLLVRDAIFYADLATMNRKDPLHAVRKLFFADNREDADNFKPDTYLFGHHSRVHKMDAGVRCLSHVARADGFCYNDHYSSLAVMRGCLSGFRHGAALISSPTERVSRVGALL
jgi:LmbE family N-acetylglucosaminyl deacetylase